MDVRTVKEKVAIVARNVRGGNVVVKERLLFSAALVSVNRRQISKTFT